MERKVNLHDNLAYHCDLLNVPLDTSLVPKMTDMVFSLIAAERATLVDAIIGLKKEVNHYKTLLLTEQEVEMKVERPRN
jgi:hypothetical protein